MSTNPGVELIAETIRSLSEHIQKGAVFQRQTAKGEKED